MILQVFAIAGIVHFARIIKKIEFLHTSGTFFLCKLQIIISQKNVCFLRNFLIRFSFDLDVIFTKLSINFRYVYI